MLSSGIPEGPRFVYRAQPITSRLSLPFNQQKSAERLLYTKLPLGIYKRYWKNKRFSFSEQTVINHCVRFWSPSSRYLKFRWRNKI